MSVLADKLSLLGPPVLVREQAFEQVRDAILAGTLAPGTRLIERELCLALGISRASVREMIRRLEAERLIRVEGRKSPVVSTLTRKQAAEIYEVRALFESLLIRRFTDIASDAEIAELRTIFEAVREAATKNSINEIVALMRRLNEHLVHVVDHELIEDLLGQLNARINWLRVKAMTQPGRLETSISELSAILEAIEQRDAERAALAMAQSSANARNAALEQLLMEGSGERQPKKMRSI
ncbi:GntR family transcriptional regulator [Phyllobacterium sp. 21LDTY02-6]|uniref:GntR family transcriptional regulator n=1 Tax=Phyllobacterium sp. 21LDTY02-6 TaxID=2944903 RepID=UPI0020228F86|nr:GntR family transcriptional regulator [Phyllobacterium sp. 21LDTY02-6]MCO4319171.1 GntR family transcriptional regulator [Phyllobacterium sp. 21LDTY02-6]